MLCGAEPHPHPQATPVPGVPKPLVLMSDATAGCYFPCTCLDDLTRTLEVVQNQISIGGSVVRVKCDGANDAGSLALLGVDPGMPMTIPGMAAPPSQPRQAGSGTGTWAVPEEFWVDRQLLQLPPRPAHPILIVGENVATSSASAPTTEKTSGGPGAAGPGGGGGGGGGVGHDLTPEQALDILTAMGVPVDW